MEKIRTWDPFAYVIVFEKDDGECRYHGSELQNGQAALRCYPSPFDALLDISRNPASVVESGQFISIQPLSALRPHAGSGRGFHAVTASIHVAWRAVSGELLIRLDGMPDAVLFSSPELESGDAVRELPAVFVRMADEIHEQAGLFAWKETASAFAKWSERELCSLAHQAWRDAPTTAAHGAKPGIEQFALYDPEFRQWHFVPVIDVLER